MGILGGIICIVCGNSYNSLITGRLLQGLGTTAYESLSLSVLGDMFVCPKIHLDMLNTAIR